VADIFLSYSREDAKTAGELARVLDQLGWSVFWDRRIPAGSSWDEVVEGELHGSRCVVVLWSQVSVKSRWVRTEANFGLRAGTLVPVALDATDPPIAFQLVEAAQLQNWDGDIGHPEFVVLTEGISRHAAARPVQVPPPKAALAIVESAIIEPVRSAPIVVSPPEVLKPSAAPPEPAGRVPAAVAEERPDPVPVVTNHDGANDATTARSSALFAATSSSDSHIELGSPASAPAWSSGRVASIGAVAAALIALFIATQLRSPESSSQVTPTSRDVSESSPGVSAQPTQTEKGAPDQPSPSTVPPKTESTALNAPPSAPVAANSMDRPSPDASSGASRSGPASVVWNGSHVRFRSDAWNLPDEPLLGFVEVPAGQFTMGSDPRVDSHAREEELPQHKVSLPTYYMAKYAVTVAQFRSFLEATQYKGKDNDTSMAFYIRKEDSRDLPAAYADWYDAVAYTRWLDAQVRAGAGAAGPLRAILEATGRGCRISIPSEAEWEKGARGTDARLYPWGNTFDLATFNLGRKNFQSRAAVGSYPDNASPYGLLDTKGGMWEWTRSLGRTGNSVTPIIPYPYRTDDATREDLNSPGNAFRVQRGGRGGDVDVSARIAFRLMVPPVLKGPTDGFRAAITCAR
jgi:formylglycine-generating enzyme required for sulfatase activity